MTPGNTKPPTPRAVRVLACVATVPILLVCAELARALPGLDLQGQGRADGEV